VAGLIPTTRRHAPFASASSQAVSGLYRESNYDTGSPTLHGCVVLEDCQAFAEPGNKMSTGETSQNDVPACEFRNRVSFRRFR
jgi:hypothetical protein